MIVNKLVQIGCIAALIGSIPETIAKNLDRNSQNSLSPQGKFFGQFKLTMNTAQLLGEPTWKELNGVTYSVLGQSHTQSYWLWDFDNKTVTWGGGNVFAMEMFYVPFQAFNSNYIEDKRTDTHPLIYDLNEITSNLTENEDGTYSLDYAQKMYLDLQGYPIGSATTTFKVTLEGETLSITTIDKEADDVALNGITGIDGIPGTRINNVFPFVIQPQWDSVIMQKDKGTDSNQDGITDVVASIMGADPYSMDSDNDGLTDAEEIGDIFVNPPDSDGDTIADIIDPKDISDELEHQTIVKLISKETIRLTAPETEILYSASAEAIPAQWQLAERLDNFANIDLSMGVLNYRVSTHDTRYQTYLELKNQYMNALTAFTFDDSIENQQLYSVATEAFSPFANEVYTASAPWTALNPFDFETAFENLENHFNDNIITTLAFENKIPQGLTLIRRIKSMNNEADSYIPVNWQYSDEKLIKLLVETHNKSYDRDPSQKDFDAIQLIIAHAINNPPEVSIDGPETIDEGKQLTLTANGFDPDNDALSYQWLQIAGPSVNFSATNEKISFIAPDIKDNQTLTFQVTVNDGELTSTANMNVKVNAARESSGGTINFMYLILLTLTVFGRKSIATTQGRN